MRAIAFVIAAVMGGSTGATVLVTHPFSNNADGNNGFDSSSFDSGVLSSSIASAGAGLGVLSLGTDSWSGSMQVL